MAYDADGRLTSDAEPAGGGYQSPATISYGYYPDGLRQTLSVSSSALNATNAFQYSYRSDGLLKTQHLTYPVTGDFAWTYTNAGRELTQSDPYTGNVISGSIGSRTLQAKTFSYDSSGRVASLVLPQGYTYGSFTYDGEDETTGYTRSNAYCPLHCGNPTRAQTYNVRGELIAVNDSTTSINYTQSSADGTLVTLNGSAQPLDGFDARSGMIKAKYLNHNGSTIPYAYDGAGRQTQVTDTYLGGSATATRAYDAENHVVSQSYGGNFECPFDGSLAMCGNWSADSSGNKTVNSGSVNSYGWGPNGHPIQLVGNFSGNTPSGDTVSEHWDGDDVLFEASQLGLADVQVGKLAAGISSSDFTIADRDMTGQQVSSHTATAFGAWDAGAPTHQCSACSKGEGDKTIPGSVDSTWVSNDQPSSYNPATSFLSGVREDGYNDGFGNTFQGVRAYDPNLGQWTSPDAYAGEVHDPVSQKPFMWNHNNPLSYSDPTGYTSTVKQDDNQMTITVYVQFNGDGTPEGATARDNFIKALNSYAGSFGNWNVTVDVEDAKNAPDASLVNTINIEPGNAESAKNNRTNQWTIGTSYNQNSLVHEAGHVIGMPDTYPLAGNHVTTHISNFWAGNVMHEKGGSVDYRNFDLLSRFLGNNSSGRVTTLQTQVCDACFMPHYTEEP